MRRLVILALALFATLPVGAILESGTALAAATGPALVPGATDGSVQVRAGSLDASDRWIVVLRDGLASPAAALATANARASAIGIHEDRVFNGTFRGYSARLTNAQLGLLRADSRVETVVPDDIISLTGQTVPTGVRRVFGLHNAITNINGTDTRVDADVAIVDTGIDPHQADLNVVGGINCSTSNASAWFDANGHGTHVAGIVGALDNGFGVVGVAPGVRLWAVRILNPQGNGLLSWYECGLDWIAAQKDPNDPTRPLFEAVNMSVAKPGHDDRNCGYTNNDIMHRAICRVVDAGITVVAAAGNNHLSAGGWVPAAYDEVITVSALADTDGLPGGHGGHACYSWNGYDQDDTFADFSNFGSDVDLIAPGKCILSTLPGNKLGVMSGTSMAAPLVTGAAALWKSTRPNATPLQVKLALRSMGNLNWKTSTDPDKIHEPLLDVSWIVNAGDFAMRYLGGTVATNSAGRTFNVAMNVARAEDLALPLDLTVSAPNGVTASVSPTHLAPTDGSGLTATITVPPNTPSGTYPVTVTASDGTRQRSAVVKVLVDSAPPVMGAATFGAVVGRQLGATTVPGIVRWSATDDIGPITAYQVQWSVDGRWLASTTVSGTTHGISHSFTVWHRYAFRVRARDGAGNWSSWATAAVMSPSRVQDTSGSLHWSGTWRRSTPNGSSGGTTRFTSQAGASMTYAFSGRGVAIVAPRSATRGRLSVYIDGKLVGTADEHASSYQAREVVYSVSGLTAGRHTLRLVNQRTSGRPRVDVDAVVVLR